LLAAFVTVKVAAMNIVIIGNGMVGYKFCEKLISKGQSPQFQITVFGEEVRPAYDRVHLSEFFSGKSAEDLAMALSVGILIIISLSTSAILFSILTASTKK
jgi:pyrroline-5-carboxylate reductase